MKSFLLGLFIASSALPMTSFASGSSVRGGGDLCEDRIKVVRDDLKDWILKGGPKNLKLPNGLSAETYSKGMTTQIQKAKISCVGAKDPGYPVEVYGTPKVCRFERTFGLGSIVCDFEKFQKMTASDQYILIHHEFAGLAGFENPQRDDSDYSISNQISGYLEDQTIKKLVVTKRPAEKKFETLTFALARHLFAQGREPVIGRDIQLETSYNSCFFIWPNESNYWYKLLLTEVNGSIYLRSWIFYNDGTTSQDAEALFTQGSLSK